MKPLLFLLFLIPAIAPTRAQPSGSIEGTVREFTGNEPIPGARVLLAGSQRGVSTHQDGTFQLNGVPAGTYTLQVSALGYRTFRLNRVIVNPGLRSKIDIHLEVSPIELSPIEVTAEKPLILKDVTGTVHTTTAEQIDALPVASVTDVVGLQPGVTDDLHVRGGKTSEVIYLIDGLPVQDLIGGGLGSDLPKSSVAGLVVQTGGYEAEYGNALSGVVNLVTRSGGESVQTAVRAEKDDLFGGQQKDRANEIELINGGPIVQDNLYYFASGRVLLSDTRYWQDLDRFFSSPVTKEYNGFGKIDYRGSPVLRLSAQILYLQRQWHDYEFSWRFNLSGLPPRKSESYRAAAFLTYTPSTSTTYSLSLSRFSLRQQIGNSDKSSVDTTLYQYDFFLQYIIAGSRSWWVDSRQTIHSLKGDMTTQLGDQHFLKVGMELNVYSIFSDAVRYEPWLNVFGKPFVSKPLLDYSTDYRYYPYSGSAFMQDKIELRKDGMLLSLGLRYDFLDPRAERPAAEFVPQGGNDYQTLITGYVPARRKQYFSPRIGFAAPFAEQGYLFVNYGHFVQFPLFDYLYSGLNNVSLKKGVGALVGNPDLEAERTKAWEFSVKYALENNVVLSATYFDKTTYNQVDVKTFIPSNARIAGDYGFAEFVNNPYAKAVGLELMVAREKGSWFTGSLSYTLMQAEGLSQDARQGLSYYEWGIEPPARLFPLSWDQRHSLKLIANLALPLDFHVNIVWSFHSGRPFTYYPTSDGFTPLDSTMKFQPNNNRLSDFSQVDVKASKTFGSLDDLVCVVCYVDVRNLFNRANVLWVDSSGKIGGELGDISAYGQPRRIRVGLRVEL